MYNTSKIYCTCIKNFSLSFTPISFSRLAIERIQLIAVNRLRKFFTSHGVSTVAVEFVTLNLLIEPVLFTLRHTGTQQTLVKNQLTFDGTVAVLGVTGRFGDSGAIRKTTVASTNAAVTLTRAPGPVRLAPRYEDTQHSFAYTVQGLVALIHTCGCSAGGQGGKNNNLHDGSVRTTFFLSRCSLLGSAIYATEISLVPFQAFQRACKLRQIFC